MSTLALSYLIESYSFLQVTRTVMKAWMSLNFCQISSPTTELAALERLKNECIMLWASFLIESYSFLHVTRTAIKAWMGLKFSKIWPRSTELAALERLKKSQYTYNGRNVVSSLVLSVLNESTSFLQVTRPTIKAWMSLNFWQIPSLTTELAALERLKNECIMLWAL